MTVGLQNARLLSDCHVFNKKKGLFFSLHFDMSCQSFGLMVLLETEVTQVTNSLTTRTLDSEASAPFGRPTNATADFYSLLF